MATNPKIDEKEGKRDTEGRHVLTDEDEKRQEEESKEACRSRIVLTDLTFRA